MRNGLYIKGLLGLAIALNGIGYIIGQENSPNYDDEFGAMAYLFSHASFTVSDDGLEYISLTAGPYRYKYNVGNEHLNWKLRDLESIASLNRRRSSIYEYERFGKWLGLSTIIPASAGAAAIALKKSLDEPPLLRAARGGSRIAARRILTIIAIGAISGYGGYRLGYEDTADWENKKFLSVMKDKKYYRRLAKDFVTCTIIDDDTDVDFKALLLSYAEFSGRNHESRIKKGRILPRMVLNKPTTYSDTEFEKKRDNSIEIDKEEKDLDVDISNFEEVFKLLDTEEFRKITAQLRLENKSKTPFCEALLDYALNRSSKNPFAHMLR